MRYLDALKQSGGDPKDSVLPRGENKMARGNRDDQGGVGSRDPRDVLSSSRGEEGMSASRVTKLAHEVGVDLRTVKGTGPGGQITEKDVRNAARTKAPSGTDSTKDEDKR